MSTKLLVKGTDGKLYQISPAPEGSQSRETCHAARAVLEAVVSAIGAFRLVDDSGATIIEGKFTAAFRGRTRRECEAGGFRDLHGLDLGLPWASERAPDQRTAREISLGEVGKDSQGRTYPGDEDDVIEEVGVPIEITMPPPRSPAPKEAA